MSECIVEQVHESLAAAECIEQRLRKSEIYKGGRKTYVHARVHEPSRRRIFTKCRAFRL